MALNDMAIRRTKAGDKPVKLSDGGGLFLLVNPNGSKWWRHAYRYDGKQKTLSLGVYPEISLAVARERHAAARKQLAQGVDPGQNRKTKKEDRLFRVTNTFQSWGDRWHQHWQAGKSPRHADYVRRRLDIDVFPRIGDRPIADISAPDIVKTVKAIAERGALDIAKRAHQTIAQIFRYAIAHGDQSGVTRNPSTDIRPSDIIPSRIRQNYARVELKELPELLRQIDAASISQSTRIAIKLMAYTFVRTGELIGGRWDEVDLEAGEWRIPASRMKMKTPHIVPLSRQATDILQTLYLLSGDTPYFFPSQKLNGKTPTMSNGTILVALKRMGYDGVMTGHGFRGLASTALHEQGFEHIHIELQLAHSDRNAVSAAYNHALYLKQRAELMQHWADYLDEIKAGAKIIPMAQRA